MLLLCLGKSLGQQPEFKVQDLESICLISF